MKRRFWPTCVDFISGVFANLKTRDMKKTARHLRRSQKKGVEFSPCPARCARFASITRALLNFRRSHLGIPFSAFRSRSLVLSLYSLTLLFSPPVRRFCCFEGYCFSSWILSSISGLLKLHSPIRPSFLLAHLTNCRLQVERPLIWLITCYNSEVGRAMFLENIS